MEDNRHNPGVSLRTQQRKRLLSSGIRLRRPTTSAEALESMLNDDVFMTAVYAHYRAAGSTKAVRYRLTAQQFNLPRTTIKKLIEYFNAKS